MRKCFFGACVALVGASTAQPTSATHADSGWVPLWNGTDFTGLYDYAVGVGLPNVNTQTTFTIQAGTIRCNGSPNGYLGTIRQYSWYRVHVEYQWPVGTATNANAGLLIHLDSAQAFSPTWNFSNNRPRSCEVNMRRDTNFPWSLWSASALGPYITTTVNTIPAAGVAGRYQAGGTVWTDDPWGTGNTRVITGDLQANPELALGQWNRGEARLFGDSGVFILNGQTRTSGWNFQLRQNIANPTPRVSCFNGNIGLQSEGAQIFYRNFEIMELDSVTGLPINARRGCTNSSALNYDPRAVVDNGSCTTTAVGWYRHGSRAAIGYFRSKRHDVRGRRIPQFRQADFRIIE